jgi:hypothetical protein
VRLVDRETSESCSRFKFKRAVLFPSRLSGVDSNFFFFCNLFQIKTDLATPLACTSSCNKNLLIVCTLQACTSATMTTTTAPSFCLAYCPHHPPFVPFSTGIPSSPIVVRYIPCSCSFVDVPARKSARPRRRSEDASSARNGLKSRPYPAQT